MGTIRTNSRGLRILAVLSVAGAVGACHTVSPDDLDASLASLRQEMTDQMQAGDNAVSQRLGDRLTGVERRTAQLDTDLQKMRSDFEVSIQELKDQLRFDVPVYFAFDDATVKDQDHAVLDKFSSVAKEYYPDATVTVEGFTDPSGSAQYNLALGMRRASAVADYLVASGGLMKDQVRAVSYGENTQRLIQPQDHGPGSAGWQNRRVVLVIDHDGQAPAPAVAQDGRPITE
jgi:peptidoglycan-associated lipoprotein